MKIKITKVPSNIRPFGGSILTNGGTFSDGAIHINVGGTHSENPNEGVLMGVDNQGVPNLVEEDEVVYNDYVFSARLTVPKQKINKKEKPIQELKVLKKYEGMSYADAAKKAEHNTGVDERPNDTIAKRGFEAELEILARSQELEREIQNLKELEEAIKNMTPEEFAALQLQLEQLAQQLALEELAAQLAAMEQQAAMLQGLPMEQLVSPEELAAMQQLALMMQQAPLVQQAQMMGALGGNLHADGGELQEAALEEPLTEIPANEDVPLEQLEIPVEEMSTSQLNSAIDEIYIWAKQNGNRQLAKNARKAKKASREDKEDFVDDAQEEIRETEENRRIAEQQELERQLQEQQAALAEMQAQQEAELQVQQLAAQELLQQQAAAQLMQEQQAIQELVPLEGLNNQFAVGGTFLDWWNKYINNPLINNKAKIDYAKVYNIITGKNDLTATSEIYDALAKLYEENPERFGPYDAVNNKFLPTASSIDVDTKTLLDLLNLAPIVDLAIALASLESAAMNKPVVVSPKYNSTYGLPIYKIGLDAFSPYAVQPSTYTGTGTGTGTGRKEGYDENGKWKSGDDPNDPFPRGSNMPYWIGMGTQLGSLFHNLMTPVDYSNADILGRVADRAGSWLPTTFTPIGGLLAYKPIDRLIPRNTLTLALNAGIRTATNTNNPMKYATTLAMMNNYNNAIGTLEKQLDEADTNRLLLIAGHNDKIAEFNSTGAMQTGKANQDAYARAGMAYSEMKAKEAAMREDLERQKANAIASNWSAIPNLILNAYNNKLTLDMYGWGMRHNVWGNMGSKGGKLRRRRRRGLSF